MADPRTLPVVYAIPQMADVAVRRDLAYTRPSSESLLADTYYPADATPGSARPAVIFVHGDGSPELGPPKEWGQYRD